MKENPVDHLPSSLEELTQFMLSSSTGKSVLCVLHEIENNRELTCCWIIKNFHWAIRSACLVLSDVTGDPLVGILFNHNHISLGRFVLFNIDHDDRNFRKDLFKLLNLPYDRNRLIAMIKNKDTDVLLLYGDSDDDLLFR